MSSDGGRRGGREARRQLRAAPLAEALRPVRAGLEGGRYRPLSDADIRTIHGAALDVLERLGMAQALPSCVEACTARGAFVNEHGRLSLPARPGRGRDRRRRPTLPAVRPGSTPRPGALGQQGSLRHGRSRRAHGRPQDPGLSRVAAAGPLRRRPDRRRARPHPLLPAHPGPARHDRVRWSSTSTRSTPASPARPSMSAPASAVARR